MKYYIIAGEASGDLHGSNLMSALKDRDPAAEFRVWGGDLMEGAGGVLVRHYRDLAFMGFLEVARNIHTILGNIRFCKEDILEFSPDVLLLIDYPGFNLRIAKWAKTKGIRVFYYISPQVWAWHSSRVHGIKASVDRMFVILPFEADFYAQYDYPVDFVGHPLLDVVTRFTPDPEFRGRRQLDERPVIALLPGSRRQEIERMLNPMLAMAPRFPDYQFVIAGAPGIDPGFYRQLVQQEAADEGVRLVHGETYQLLATAEAALVTSGTATLETALFDVPEVVCYQGSPLSYWIARRLVNVNYISLVNLIVDRPLVAELIQEDFSPERLQEELTHLLTEERRAVLRAGYAELREKLGREGASERAAGHIFRYLTSDKSSGAQA